MSWLADSTVLCSRAIERYIDQSRAAAGHAEVAKQAVDAAVTAALGVFDLAVEWRPEPAVLLSWIELSEKLLEEGLSVRIDYLYTYIL